MKIYGSKEAAMNLAHLKYAVEVARTGSINKAAERLYIGQPNLSRAIKELEASLGVVIFDRSAKGMQLTPDGSIFIQYAENILKQVEAVKELFDKNAPKKALLGFRAQGQLYCRGIYPLFGYCGRGTGNRALL